MTPTDNQAPPEDSDEQPFISHLVELRDRLLKVVLVVIVIFLCLTPFANMLFTALSGPLKAHLPEGSSMVAIDVASPFFTPFKLALVMSIFIAMPFILYQLWAFVAPGLYLHERKRVIPLLVSSTALFYIGAAFAYFVVFPLVFGFLTHTAPQGVEVMTDISRYLDFVLMLFFAFGIAFEVPVFTVLLVWTGMVSQKSLRQKRPYIIVGAFVVGMLLVVIVGFAHGDLLMRTRVAEVATRKGATRAPFLGFNSVGLNGGTACGTDRRDLRCPSVSVAQYKRGGTPSRLRRAALHRRSSIWSQSCCHSCTPL